MPTNYNRNLQGGKLVPVIWEKSTYRYLSVIPADTWRVRRQLDQQRYSLNSIRAYNTPLSAPDFPLALGQTVTFTYEVETKW
ncbi:hypothetical protein FIBSPDRAFT_855659 [Athelia psychrophila]|uniref:Uncharacterized protein n=1 Tax=Athelia psychrophila TaxID=1759441 RepID=A0A166P688_9AGAM|nr:hypothetical protein FIBSPDRAFT_855659 [Fibularhizoctonia sp. CBS 109695]